MGKLFLIGLIGIGLFTTACEFEQGPATTEERGKAQAEDDVCFQPTLSTGQSDEPGTVRLQFQTGGLPAQIETTVDAPNVDSAWGVVAEVSEGSTYLLRLDFDELPEDAIVYARISVECGDQRLSSEKVEVFRP